MTYRVDLQADARGGTIHFQGRLDRAALCRLQALCRTQRPLWDSIRLRLGAGTTVEVDLLEELLAIEDIALEAESPFLARWLQGCRGGSSTRR